jgi:hypothetical protein
MALSGPGPWFFQYVLIVYGICSRAARPGKGRSPVCSPESASEIVELQAEGGEKMGKRQPATSASRMALKALG